MMKTLVVILCLTIGLNYAMWLKKKVIPMELRRVMANVTSLDSFLRVISVARMTRLQEAVTNLNKREKGLESHCPVVHPPRTKCSPDAKDLCTNDSSCPSGLCCSTGCIKECVSGRKPTGGLLARLSENSDFPDLPYVILDSAPCAPRPVVVEVPQPVDSSSFYFPFFVTLHRCGGACNERPFETSCQPEGKNDLNLVVSKVAWSSAKAGLEEISNEFTAVRVTNHTTCSCGCKVKPTDCDKRTQQYSKEHCSCQCKSRSTLCPSNFRWDPLKCQCRCDPTNIESKCTKRFQFDKETCRCTCSKRPCKQSEKERDPSTCMCKCPSIRCPSGMTLDRRTCHCLGNRD